MLSGRRSVRSLMIWNAVSYCTVVVRDTVMVSAHLTLVYKPRRGTWRKLHLGIDSDTGQFLASELASNDVDDGSLVEPLLDQVTGSLASFTGDGVHGQASVYRIITQRYPDAQVIGPPQSTVNRAGIPGGSNS
jgi:hypothetical protein